MQLSEIKLVGSGILKICGKILNVSLLNIPIIGDIFSAVTEKTFNELLSRYKYRQDVNTMLNNINNLATEPLIDSKLETILTEITIGNVIFDTEKQRKKYAHQYSAALMDFAVSKLATGQKIEEYCRNSDTFKNLLENQQKIIILSIDSVLQLYVREKFEQLDTNDKIQAIIISEAVGRGINKLESLLQDLENKISQMNSKISEMGSDLKILIKHFGLSDPITTNNDKLEAPEFEDDNLENIELSELFALVAQKDPNAEFKLALCYYYGINLNKDEKEAFRLFEQAAKHGNARAQCNLGVCYELGKGVGEWDTEAFKCYMTSAQNGNAKAQCNVASCYDNGYGVERDTHLAFNWYIKAAEQGIGKAQASLGLMYLYGFGVDKDEKQAIKWLELAVKQKITLALTLLARCYLDGRGVEINAKKAYDLFLQAATENKNDIAQYFVALQYFLGLGVNRDITLAFDWMHKAAEQGEETAQAYLGSFYLRGIGTQQDYEKAMTWLKKAVENNDPLGNALMASCYLDGVGTKQDINLALVYAQRASKSNNPIGHTLLGLMQIRGLGCEQDIEQGTFLLLRGAKQGLPEAISFLHQIYDGGIIPSSLVKSIESFFESEKGNNEIIEKAQDLTNEIIKQKACEGDARMQFEMGVRLLQGIGIEKNELEGVQWLEKAVKQNFIQAYSVLAQCYFLGVGVDKNIDFAIDLAQKAASYNDTNGETLLVQIMDQIDSTEENEDNDENAINSFKILLKLAQKEDANAQYRLAHRFRKGKGIEKNLEEAYYWFRQAAKHGNVDAQFFLGRCYEFGEGINQDRGLAVLWYSKAAEKGDEFAAYRLGQMFFHGKGTAVYWYISAAKKGHTLAQYQLGYCLENGEGIKQDLEEALKWYSKAAENGNEEALEAKKRLEEFN